MTTDQDPRIEALLVEDDDTTRVFLQSVMEGMGYAVEACPFAEDALDRYRERFFPVIVVDWLMPEGRMDGLELIRRIRTEPGGDRSAILVVTIRVEASDLEAVMDAGADDYIPKPVAPEVLRIRLRIAQQRTRHLVARASAEYALEQSETRLRTVVANAPLILFLLDRKGVFTYADGRGLSLLGLTRRDVVGQSVFDVYRDVPDIAAHVSRALAGETFTADTTVRGVSLESWYTPLQSGPERSTAGVIIVSTDVTERKQVERELRESEERFRSFAEAAFEGLALLDRGLVIDANRQIADMFGVDPKDVLGTRALDFVAKEDRVRANRYLTESRTTPFEVTAMRRTGEKIRVEVRLRPLAVGDRLVTVAAVHDITQKRTAEEERKRLEEQFRQAQKLESLGVLAGGIAHDFNNLLMGVLGNASLALMDLPEESPVTNYVTQIEKAAQRAAELTNQMLAFSGKGRFVVKRLNLSDFIKEKARYLEDSIGPSTTIQYRLDEDLPEIDGDLGQVRQIITNLVANAADAIGEAEGVIRISTGVRRITRDAMRGTLFAGDVVDGFRVYLEVRDSGIGMDHGTLARVFDPFFTTKFTGRGLGMAAVLGIVRGHNGAIKIASQQNSGTTVTVLLPPADEAEVPTIAVEEAPPAAIDESKTILVIDDEEAVRMVTGTMLERSGFTVLLAEDGRKGIELYRSNAPDIVAVLLDLTMPDLGGDQVFEEIRGIDPSARVILMSGYDQKEATKRFGSEGLAGFLQKPFAARVLRERLASLTTT